MSTLDDFRGKLILCNVKPQISKSKGLYIRYSYYCHDVVKMMIQMTTALLLLYYKGDGFPEMMLETIKEKEEAL